MMQANTTENFKTGIFIKELKNRFLCEVAIDSERVVCYVPSSCHLSNFLELCGKEVFLVPTASSKSKTPYALFAVPYKYNYIVLNTSMANRAVEASIHRRLFAYLGRRKEVVKEHSIEGYKCDLYIEDTDTIVEIKSIISVERKAIFPSVFSERTIRQLKALSGFLNAGRKVSYCIVSLHPYVDVISVDRNTEFATELQRCLERGMDLHGFTTRLIGKELTIEREIPVKLSS